MTGEMQDPPARAAIEGAVMPGAPLLHLQGVTKRFGGLIANDAIDLEVGAGEIVALLGENGAGKTTLMNILFGHYVADAGSISIADAGGRSAALAPGSPQAALAAGIGMVHQHFTLAHNLTGLENIVLGTASIFGLGLAKGAARARIGRLMADTGLAAPLDMPVERLSVGERQRIEILKALYRHARVLVLDEPTAVLTPRDAEGLFAAIRSLAARGLAVIFISHKLGEVLALAHRIVILRHGRKVADLPAAGADRETLAWHMIGQPLVHRSERRLQPEFGKIDAQQTASALTHEPCECVSALEMRQPTAARAGPPVLELDGVTCGEGRDRLIDASLTLRGGEIVGIAGVSGNGQRGLANLIAGLERAWTGRAIILGEKLGAGPREMIARGVGRLTEDRHHDGIVADLTVAENLVLERTRSPAIARCGLLRRRAIRAEAEAAIRAFDVRGPGPDSPIRLLSGGNIQKLLLARALHGRPRLILANQPTRGLDIGAAGEVHRRLQEAAGEGAGVLLISEDLDELLALAHRIAVLHAGHLTPAIETAALDMQAIGLAMAGQPSGAFLGAQAADSLRRVATS